MMKKNSFLPSLIKVMMFVFCLAISTFAMSQQKIVSMEEHATIGLVCTDCHTNGDTKYAEATVVGNCIACHAKPGEAYYHGLTDGNGMVIKKEYPESGKTKLTAMHDSHGGEIRCTVCHTSHKEPEALYCNNCHQFDVKIK